MLTGVLASIVKSPSLVTWSNLGLILFHGSLKSKLSGSTEVEYRAMASTVAEVVWLVGLFKELHVTIKLHVPIYSDSSSALQIAANLVFQERTKHIDIDCHFVREKIQDGLVFATHRSSVDQPADILTKGS